MNQKNNMIIAVVVIIILAVVAIIALKSRNSKVEDQQPITQTEVDLNQAIKSDTTTSINANLDSLSVEDTTGDEELETVDKELLNL
jgi:type II secretory pathway pseudopilin PulG